MRNNRKKIHIQGKSLEGIVDKFTEMLASHSSYALIVIAALLFLSLVRNISTITSANSTISETKLRLDNLKTEHEKLSDQVEEVQSQDFKETQAREQLGLAKPGETVLVLPDEEIVRKISPIAEEKEEVKLPLPNWQKWLRLFL